MKTLYVWAIPANAIGRWADHTWVTSFDTQTSPYASLADVQAAGEDLWMCWGSFHPRGGAPGHPDGLLGSAPGSLEFARCLVGANADSVHVPAARGAVHIYGVEGVCHQVANEVLLATRGAQPAITANGSRGYNKSVYVYGQYGLAHHAWRDQVRACEGPAIDGEVSGMVDDFVDRAQAVLAERDDLFGRLMQMRRQYQAQLGEQRNSLDLSAAAIDRQHREHMAEVAEMLGRERFQAIFDYAPEEDMKLVDPEIYAASRASDQDGNG